MRKIVQRIAAQINGLKRDDKGIAAVEFALVLPILVIMLLGTVELGQALTIDRRIIQAASFMNCGSSIRVGVQSNVDLSQINAPSGTDANGNLIADGSLGFNSGVGSDYVLVTVFYKWDFIATLPFVSFGNMSDGSLLIRSQAAFRNEPF